MSESLFLRLLLVFAPLSLLSFGGGQAMVAEMRMQTVDVYGWLSNTQFTNLYAISKVAPGPSTLVAALVGWHIASFAGAVTVTLAMYAPSSCLMLAAGYWWNRHKESRFFSLLERSLTPMAIGLFFAGAYSVLEAAKFRPIDFAVLAVIIGLLYFTSLNPLKIMMAIMIIYALPSLV